MPYTQEELKTHPFYQNLLNADEQNYLREKELLNLKAAISGSSDLGSLLIRDESGTILLFENPYTNNIPKDSSTKIIVSTIIDELKNDQSVDEFIDRTIREL